ncbi:TetR/AcrR family transcriptional regulator [Blastococcus haudaquaticus]|uniref:Transcriptional regulator, TetR family n=1 Tax=Blastococcus haudaquaticus TaxID=1938745 RepID=A0A286H6M1_9ACTN|nr:TetR/AcrR family transcriptional regulator [Blastococcus haudaquaticus]SOE03417.1 transcriptional regulator, TetR family [Blastococcus haudaquaticus]
MQQVAEGRGAPPPADVPPASEPAPQDGRRSRWTEHRRARREDLVGAAVEAVRTTGPDFAVDDVARSAGVSKTVIYRYFSDKDELVDAVLERISDTVLLPRLLGEIVREHGDDRAALRAVIAAFVSLIEDEPELYRFAYAHTGRSGRADLVAATEHRIADALAALFAERMEAAGQPSGAAATWAYGLVGMVQLTSHWWATTRSVPSTELVEQLVALADGGLGALLPPRA